MKKKILVFHPALVPYRVDFFNAFSHAFNAKFYFKYPNALTQNFNQAELRSKCEFTCYYLDKGFDFFGKSYRSGVISKVQEIKPDFVLCSEYGPITILLLIYSKFLNRSFKLYTISDDSIDGAIKRRGFRAIVRNVIAKNIDGVIFNSEVVFEWHQKHISEKIKKFILPIIHKDDVLRIRFRDSIEKANHNIEVHGLVGKKVTLFVGRLEKVKNVDFLIEAFIKVNDENSILGSCQSHIDHGTQNFILRLEVIIKIAARYPHDIGNVCERGMIETVPIEQLIGGLDNVIAGRLVAHENTLLSSPLKLGQTS